MTETDIIKGCIQKKQNCQRFLFERFAGKMMSVCLRYVNDQSAAQDILQEGFIRVFNCIHQFKFEGSFEGWMRRVFVSVATRQISKQKIDFTDINIIDTDSIVIDPNIVSKLSEDEIHRLIRSLPDGYRIVFNLNVIEGYTHDEIATMLGIMPTTSRTQLLKARKMLQGLILKHFNVIRA